MRLLSTIFTFSRCIAPHFHCNRREHCAGFWRLTHQGCSTGISTCSEAAVVVVIICVFLLRGSRRRRGEVKSVAHWGQRKLMLSEVEFLTRFAEPNIICVYAGAAPGTHIAFLSELFPEVTFVLVDPSDFSVRPTPRIQIRQEFMTDTVCRLGSHY